MFEKKSIWKKYRAYENSYLISNYRMMKFLQFPVTSQSRSLSIGSALNHKKTLRYIIRNNFILTPSFLCILFFFYTFFPIAVFGFFRVFFVSIQSGIRAEILFKIINRIEFLNSLHWPFQYISIHNARRVFFAIEYIVRNSILNQLFLNFKQFY